MRKPAVYLLLLNGSKGARIPPPGTSFIITEITEQPIDTETSDPIITE